MNKINTDINFINMNIDKINMTKMGGNVHFPVMQTAYALWSHLQYLEEVAG